MKTAHIILVILVICFGAFIFISYKPVWQYDHLERNASKVITGTELQVWATNLLARYPMETNFYPSQLGTNFPPQLRKLAPKLGPYVAVHISPDEIRQPSFVQISWEGGILDGSGFYVGPTNFITVNLSDLTNGIYVRDSDGYYVHLWQPGVWFFRKG
jgi:hypothetical protein